MTVLGVRPIDSALATVKSIQFAQIAALQKNKDGASLHASAVSAKLTNITGELNAFTSGRNRTNPRHEGASRTSRHDQTKETKDH